MKRFMVFCIVVVVLMSALFGTVAAQSDPSCNPDQIVVDFGAAITAGNYKAWASAYETSTCTDKVKEGVVALVRAYEGMGGSNSPNACEEFGTVCEVFATPEQSRNADTFVWVNQPGSIEDSMSESCARSGAYGLNLVYGFSDKGNGGWGVQWEGSPNGVFDMTPFKALIFYAKGGSGGEIFQIGLRDRSMSAGKEPKLESKKVAIVSGDKWIKFKVDLTKMPKLKLNEVINLTFGFNLTHGSGNLCIDDISFE